MTTKRNFFRRFLRIPRKIIVRVFYEIGKKYANYESVQELKSLPSRPNERIIEYSYVLNSLKKVFPKTVLDVGPGLSSLPHLLLKCALDVAAVDNFEDYWGSNNFNRHFRVFDSKIENFNPATKFDLVYCVSTLEHISNSDEAVASMFALLNPKGYLILTFPYCETQYHPNIYMHEKATFGKHVNYICQVFSRSEINRWIETHDAKIIDQEYWRIYSGEMHTFGDELYPYLRVEKDELHQLTCILFQKN